MISSPLFKVKAGTKKGSFFCRIKVKKERGNEVFFLFDPQKIYSGILDSFKENRTRNTKSNQKRKKKEGAKKINVCNMIL